MANATVFQSTNRHDPFFVGAVREITQDPMEFSLSWFMSVDGIGGWKAGKRDKPQTMLIIIDVKDPFETFRV